MLLAACSWPEHRAEKLHTPGFGPSTCAICIPYYGVILFPRPLLQGWVLCVLQDAPFFQPRYLNDKPVQI